MTSLNAVVKGLPVIVKIKSIIGAALPILCFGRILLTYIRIILTIMLPA